MSEAILASKSFNWHSAWASGPLFGDALDAGDSESGTIYVLRSRSEHPEIAPHRTLIHKIGVTGGSVDARIANASADPTYLMAPVEIVATYKLANIDRAKLEALLHRIFAPARLDVTIADRFGRPLKPREWYRAPLPAIDEAVRRITDGSILGFAYDPGTATLRPAPPPPA